MSMITKMLLSQLGGGQLEQMAGAIGADSGTTQRAVEAALPALMAGLAKNASSPSGAASLASALDSDHDGSVLDNVGSLLGAFGGGGGSKSGLGGLLGAAAGMLGGGGSSRATNGAGILKHVFGNKKTGVEQAIGQASGLDAGQAGKLLMMLAPMVMGALGKAKKERGLDAGAIAGMLAGEKEELASASGGLGGLMGMLDSDGDGDISDDVTKLGAGLLKNFLSK
ncbi:MAG: DUF937 domain-containing protein [Rhodothermales bacterium]|nr:DUF937 domain-containing protein [Rhodothermales bacterium]